MALAYMKSDRECLFPIFPMHKLLFFLTSVHTPCSYTGCAIFGPGVLGEVMSFQHHNVSCSWGWVGTRTGEVRRGHKTVSPGRECKQRGLCGTGAAFDSPVGHVEGLGCPAAIPTLVLCGQAGKGKIPQTRPSSQLAQQQLPARGSGQLLSWPGATTSSGMLLLVLGHPGFLWSGHERRLLNCCRAWESVPPTACQSLWGT